MCAEDDDFEQFTWNADGGGSYFVEDWQCDEFVDVMRGLLGAHAVDPAASAECARVPVSARTHAMLGRVLHALDELWADVYSRATWQRYALVPVDQAIAERDVLSRRDSTFLRQLKTVPWVPASDGTAARPTQLFAPSVELKQLFAGHVLYVQSLPTSPGLPLHLGITSQPSLGLVRQCLLEWAGSEDVEPSHTPRARPQVIDVDMDTDDDPATTTPPAPPTCATAGAGPDVRRRFRASVAQMHAVYCYLQAHLSEDHGPTVAVLRARPCIFVPDSAGASSEAEVDGAWYSTADVCVGDDSGLVDDYGPPRVLSRHYPSCSAFTRLFPDPGIPPAPSAGQCACVLRRIAGRSPAVTGGQQAVAVLTKLSDVFLALDAATLRGLFGAEDRVLPTGNAPTPSLFLSYCLASR